MTKERNEILKDMREYKISIYKLSKKTKIPLQTLRQYIKEGNRREFWRSIQRYNKIKEAIEKLKIL